MLAVATSATPREAIVVEMTRLLRDPGLSPRPRRVARGGSRGLSRGRPCSLSTRVPIMLPRL